MQLCRRLLLCCGQSGAERVVLVAELHILLEQALVFDGQGRLLGGQGGLLGPQALHQLLHLVHLGNALTQVLHKLGPASQKDQSLHF